MTVRTGRRYRYGPMLLVILAAALATALLLPSPVAAQEPPHNGWRPLPAGRVHPPAEEGGRGRRHGSRGGAGESLTAFLPADWERGGGVGNRGRRRAAPPNQGVVAAVSRGNVYTPARAARSAPTN